MSKTPHPVPNPSPTRWPVGFDCARTCQLETTGAEAPVVAEALAGQVAATLKTAR